MLWYFNLLKLFNKQILSVHQYLDVARVVQMIQILFDFKVHKIRSEKEEQCRPWEIIWSKKLGCGKTGCQLGEQST